VSSRDGLAKEGVGHKGLVFISDRAHMVFDFHQTVDGSLEDRLGRNKIGTTKKGIGPAYASKISQNGVRVGDLRDWDYFEERFRALAEHHMRSYEGLKIDIDGQLAYHKSIAPQILEMTCDTIQLTNQKYNEGKKILVEGSNAAMLDIDFGTYPYVTSSNPSVGSVMTGFKNADAIMLDDALAVGANNHTTTNAAPSPSPRPRAANATVTADPTIHTRALALRFAAASHRQCLLQLDTDGVDFFDQLLGRRGGVFRLAVSP